MAYKDTMSLLVTKTEHLGSIEVHTGGDEPLLAVVAFELGKLIGQHTGEHPVTLETRLMGDTVKLTVGR